MIETSFTRVDRSSIAARDFYNRISAFYDLLAASSERRYTGLGLRLLAVRQGQRVLEIGFGTGQALVALSHAVGAAGQVFGLDISEGMCHVARRRSRQAGVLHRVGLTQGDAMGLPFPSAYFDALFMSFTLELFDTPQIPQVLASCRRVLKPSGRLCIVSLSKDRHLGLMGQLYERLHNRFPNYLDCRPIPLVFILEQEGFNILAAQQHAMWGLPVGIALAETAQE